MSDNMEMIKYINNMSKLWNSLQILEDFHDLRQYPRDNLNRKRHTAENFRGS